MFTLNVLTSCILVSTWTESNTFTNWRILHMWPLAIDCVGNTYSKLNQNSGLPTFDLMYTNLINTNQLTSEWSNLCFICTPYLFIFFCFIKITSQHVPYCTEHLIVAQRNRASVIFNQCCYKFLLIRFFFRISIHTNYHRRCSTWISCWTFFSVAFFLYGLRFDIEYGWKYRVRSVWNIQLRISFRFGNCLWATLKCCC